MKTANKQLIKSLFKKKKKYTTSFFENYPIHSVGIGWQSVIDESFNLKETMEKWLKEIKQTKSIKTLPQSFYRGPVKKVNLFISIERGFADECLGLIEVKENDYKVGIGSVGRPYISLYKGESEEKAINTFLKELKTF